MTVPVCVICERNRDSTDPEALLCLKCGQRILRHLRELEEYLPTLSLLKPVVGSTEYISSQFGSRSPANDAVITHLDPRSDVTAWNPETSRYWRSCGCYVGECPHRPDLGAVNIVGSWARLAAEERGVTVEAHWIQQIGLLRRNHSWVCQQPWVDEFAAQLRQVHSSVRALAKDPVPRSVGKCISLDQRGDECRGDVFEMDDASGVRCSKCRRLYSGLDLDRLRVAQEAS